MEKIHKNIRVFMLSCIKHARFHGDWVGGYVTSTYRLKKHASILMHDPIDPFLL